MHRRPNCARSFLPIFINTDGYTERQKRATAFLSGKFILSGLNINSKLLLLLLLLLNTNLLLEYGRLEFGSHEAGLRQAKHTQHIFEVKTVALMATIIIIIIIITEHL